MTQTITTESVTIQVADGTTMGAHVARPAGSDKLPGVILLQEIFGVNEHMRDIASRIAAEGYVVIAPDLFHRTHPGFIGSYDDIPGGIKVASAYTNEHVEADLRATFAHLTTMEGIDAEHVAVMGYCMGGRLAFTANALIPVRAAISFYGAGIYPDKTPLAPALHGPTLFFWAGKDSFIPATQRDAVIAEMRRVGKPFTSVEVSHVNHGFFCDARSDYDAAAAAQAWAVTKAFLKSHLAGG
ncbi:dienelactone hydrolase family protein [Chondromyces crocatus]|uniref:Carboxymethylenebutenolidase n=1 Tax=Chondromyces crocatus TaxID=52 RepID=A0A0K1E9S1_CHOCO|nr:dienelactone hydrolase family protein [Chondromyces crocatus]AKT37610.1 carboxymethylenebutenolidase [Chondromyces crocatus]